MLVTSLENTPVHSDSYGEPSLLNSDGTEPISRLQSPRAFAQRRKALWDADAFNRDVRYRINMLCSSKPPIPIDELKKLGISNYPNINTGRAEYRAFMGMSSFLDMTSSVDLMGFLKVDEYKYPNDWYEYSQIISEEFHLMFHYKWDNFEYVKQLMAQYFTLYGVTVCYFKNDQDWRWSVTNLDYINFPRNTEASCDNIQEAYIRRDYQVPELFQYIKNWDCGNGMIDPHWNVPAVIKSINKAKSYTEDSDTNSNYNRLLRMFRNGDIYADDSNSSVIQTSQGFIREFDDKVSFVIQDINKPDCFLYKKICAYNNFDDALVAIPRGVGIDGTIYGVRGLGETMFPEENLYNKTYNDMLASSSISSKLVVPVSDEQRGNAKMVDRGYFWETTPEFKDALQNSLIPNLTMSALPVQNMIDRNLDNKSGSYSARAVNDMGRGITATQAEYDVLQMNTMSAASQSLFFIGYSRLLNASLRRMQNPDITQYSPGGDVLYKFFRSLERRGVPVDAFRSVDHVRVNRPIGAGSMASRDRAADFLLAVMNTLPAEQAATALRIAIAAKGGGGWLLADTLVPRGNVNNRASDQKKRADLENKLIQLGVAPTKYSDDNDYIHATTHGEELVSLFQAVNQGQVDPIKALSIFSIGLPHWQEHLVLLSKNKFQEASYNAMFKAFQNISQWAENVSRQLQAQQEQQQAAQQEQMAQVGGLSEDQMAENILLENKIKKSEAETVKAQAQAEAAILRNEVRKQDFKQKSIIRDVTAAENIKKIRSKK